MDLLVCLRVTAVPRGGDGGGGDVQGEIGEQPRGETPWTQPWGVGCPVTPCFSAQNALGGWFLAGFGADG